MVHRDAYMKIDLDKSYPALFELLWYSQLPCFDVMNVTSFESGYGKKLRNNQLTLCCQYLEISS